MDRIRGVKRLTENRFLNLYELDARTRGDSAIRYYVASRAKNTENLKAVEGHRNADGVILYGVYGENKDKLVLVRQYRYPIGDYIYEFPAGLLEPGEDPLEWYVTIQEGKFHQVKRMFHAVGKEVQYLKRLSIGTLKLDESLALGEFRPLTEEEKEGIFAIAGMK